MRIGAHVSVAGGIATAFDRALAIGAEAVQVHPTAPQTWRRLQLDEGTVLNFRARMAATGLDAFFFHAVYLINLATARDDLLAQSVGSLRHYLELATELGVRGVVFHAGSHKGVGFEAVLPQVARAMAQALEGAGPDTWLLIENSAGAGANIAHSFEQIGAMIAAVGDPRVRVCLDTAHAFTAGYDLRQAAELARVTEAFATHIGFDRLAAIHANDSKADFGSNRDRHENIGDGFLGAESFRQLGREPRLRAVPFILEVPGLEGRGPDRANVERLRALAGLPPLPPPPAGPA
ncbi:MAG TPA: deoxyribonuclease IV [Candidatus Dormibacteraeota bacterium]|nr:deoxyribonuclease IV [Candidatus Dormibacteraeota bacterium]